jgi:hypothetical protein
MAHRDVYSSNHSLKALAVQNLEKGIEKEIRGKLTIPPT